MNVISMPARQNYRANEISLLVDIVIDAGLTLPSAETVVRMSFLKIKTERFIWNGWANIAISGR